MVRPCASWSSKAPLLWGGSRSLREEQIGLGRHDEVIAVQSLDLVSPPLDAYASPLQGNARVVALRLGLLTHAGGEFQRRGEVAELEAALQPLDAVCVRQIPAGDLRVKLRNLFVRYSWRVSPSRYALFSYQGHGVNS